MSQKTSAPPTRSPAEKLVRDIRRVPHKQHSAKDNICPSSNHLRPNGPLASGVSSPSAVWCPASAPTSRMIRTRPHRAKKSSALIKAIRFISRDHRRRDRRGRPRPGRVGDRCRIACAAFSVARAAGAWLMIGLLSIVSFSSPSASAWPRSIRAKRAKDACVMPCAAEAMVAKLSIRPCRLLRT
jgi:hypothetical protein